MDPLTEVEAEEPPPPDGAAAAIRRHELDFDHVFNEFAPFVWRAMRRLGVPSADTDDACQEAFLVIHRKLPSFEGRSTLRAWIYGVCVRVASEHRRKLRRRREDIDNETEIGVPAPQQDRMDRKDAQTVLDGLLDLLDDDKRTVFVLYEVMDLPMREIAEIVGCPLQTAYSRLHSARERIELAARGIERSEGLER